MTKPHTHTWELTESRYLRGVEPKTKVNSWRCANCPETKTTEHTEPTQK